MDKEDKIDSIIGKKTVINGDVKIEGATKIDGIVEGNITAKESLIIGKDAVVKGTINCKAAIIGGNIEGNIIAQEIIELQTGARLSGDIVCKGIVIKDGVFFEGNCRMSQKTKESKETKEIKEKQ
jgi:cytoskeletal protein CcmA (bactofilin family)